MLHTAVLNSRQPTVQPHQQKCKHCACMHGTCLRNTGMNFWRYSLPRMTCAPSHSKQLLDQTATRLMLAGVGCTRVERTAHATPAQQITNPDIVPKAGNPKCPACQHIVHPCVGCSVTTTCSSITHTWLSRCHKHQREEVLATAPDKLIKPVLSSQRTTPLTHLLPASHKTGSTPHNMHAGTRVP
jgi:hypothetical protein